MNIKEQIRAEIERRRLHFNKEAEKYQALNNGYSQNCYGARDALRDLENFLDSLPEQLVKSLPEWKWVEPGKQYPVGITREMDVNGDWQYCLSSGKLYDGCQYLSLAELELKSVDAEPYSIRELPVVKRKEQPVEIHIDNPNIEKVDPSIKVETRTDGTGDIDGKAMLYVADKSYKIGFRDGKASKEQPVEGLEEEIKRYWKEEMPVVTESDLNDIARHFYELGCTRTAVMYDDIEYNRQMAEEAGNKEFEKELRQYWLEQKQKGVIVDGSIDDYITVQDVARHFAEWGAEHLKK